MQFVLRYEFQTGFTLGALAVHFDDEGISLLACRIHEPFISLSSVRNNLTTRARKAAHLAPGTTPNPSLHVRTDLQSLSSLGSQLRRDS